MKKQEAQVKDVSINNVLITFLINNADLLSGKRHIVELFSIKQKAVEVYDGSACQS